MDKKKLISSELQSWHWFIPLFAVVFVMFSFILSGNSYASTIDSMPNNVADFILEFWQDTTNSNSSVYSAVSNLTANDIKDYYNNNIVGSNYYNGVINQYGLLDWDNLVVINAPINNSIINTGNRIYLCFINYNNFSLPSLGFQNPSFGDSRFVCGVNNGQNVNLYGFSININSSGVLSGSSNYNYNNIPIYNYIIDDNNNTIYCEYVKLFKQPTIANVYYFRSYGASASGPYLYSNYYIEPVPPNTITLQAGLSSFHRFQGVGDKEQLIVYLDGYVTEDFTFFVEQYVDNEWQFITDINDYYFLYNEEDNDIYRNPYYITFTYLSGLPAGTCRYTALLNDNPETAFHSDTFTITPWSIGNDATGTVDSNGDIDISVDTGNTVEGIADFLSQSSTVTEQQFNNNFPTVEVDDPSEDFFSWIFDQIENIFTSTSAQTLQFDLFGTTYSYSSNDVYVPNNTLKTMIGLSCDFSICMWIIKDVRKVINKIKEGNIEALSDEDITANMV